MPTSWSWRSSTARSPGWGATATHYFYRQSAGEHRQPHPLGVAYLPVLHDECRAAGRLGRRLFRFDRRGRACRPSLWNQHRDNDARRPQGRDQPVMPTIPGPAKRRSLIDRRSQPLHVEASHSRLGAIPQHCGQRRCVNRMSQTSRGYVADPPAMAQRRRRRTRTADAGRRGSSPIRTCTSMPAASACSAAL